LPDEALVLAAGAISDSNDLGFVMKYEHLMGTAMIAAAATLATWLLPSASASSSEVREPGGCGGTVVQLGKMPSWTAFAGVPSPALHVTAKKGTAIGVFFSPAPPLHFGPPVNPRNKILWLVRDARASMTLRARPLGRQAPVVFMTKASEGTGPYMVPSYDNVPAPGCWAFTISEGGVTDTLDLYYPRG
jgi:hypothetical protein